MLLIQKDNKCVSEKAPPWQWGGESLTQARGILLSSLLQPRVFLLTIHPSIQYRNWEYISSLLRKSFSRFRKNTSLLRKSFSRSRKNTSLLRKSFSRSRKICDRFVIEDKKKRKGKDSGVDAKNRWVNNDDTPSKERATTKGATPTYVPACMERS